MNPNSNTSPEDVPTNSAITPTSSNDEPPLEAEIVEDLSKQNQQHKKRSLRIVRQIPRRERQAIISVVTISFAQSDSIAEAKRINSVQKPDNNWLDNFITPWSVTGLFFLLSANILLSYAQWSSYQSVAPSNSSEAVIPSSETSPTLSIPDSLNLAQEKSDRLSLNSLSAIAPSTATPPIAQTPPPAPKEIAANPTPTLSNVLLPPPAPPVAQPQPVQPVQPVQAYPIPPTVSVAPISVPSQPPLPPPPVAQAASATPVNETAKPAENQSIIETIPTFSNTSDRISEFSQRHAAEQRRQELENLPPLTFNQKVRSDRLSRQNQLDPNRMRQQLQQRQREQIEQQLPIADNQQQTPTQEIVIQQQPATTREDIEKQLSPANPQSLPNNNKPKVEVNNDGSIEIRSNTLR